MNQLRRHIVLGFSLSPVTANFYGVGIIEAEKENNRKTFPIIMSSRTMLTQSCVLISPGSWTKFNQNSSEVKSTFGQLRCSKVNFIWMCQSTQSVVPKQTHPTVIIIRFDLWNHRVFRTVNDYHVHHCIMITFTSLDGKKAFQLLIPFPLCLFVFVKMQIAQ